MKNNKIAILLKTSINYDGRVISQIDSLAKKFNNYNFRIFLLSDAPYDIVFRNNCDIYKIKLLTKNLPKSNFFKFFKMIEYALKSFYLISKYNPQILHVHDDTSSLAGVLYKLFFFRKHVIYDDHELNYIRPTNLYDKLMFALEKMCYSLCDTIIVANDYRKRISSIVYKKNKIEVFENYFYQRKSLKKINSHLLELIEDLLDYKKQGSKIILHQGVLNPARGENDFNFFVKNISGDFKFLMIGINHETFKKIVSNFDPLVKDNFIFGSYVDYEHISEIYKHVDYSLILYKNINFNNRYCAPNRVYLAAYFGVTILVNSDNIVLNDFANKLNLGLTFDYNTDFNIFLKKLDNFNDLMNDDFFMNNKNQMKIVSIYNKILFN